MGMNMNDGNKNNDRPLHHVWLDGPINDPQPSPHISGYEGTITARGKYRVVEFSTLTPGSRFSTFNFQGVIDGKIWARIDEGHAVNMDDRSEIEPFNPIKWVVWWTEFDTSK